METPRLPHAIALLVLSLGQSSCSSEATQGSEPGVPSADGSVEAEPDGTALDGSHGDAVADAGNDVASSDVVPVPDAAVTDLPLSAADVVRVGEPGGIDMMSSALSLGAETLVVFDRFDSDYLEARLQSIRSPENLAFSNPLALSFGEQVYQAAPSILSTHGSSYLYLQLANTLYDDAPTLVRCAYDGFEFSDPEVLPVIPGVDFLLSWPAFLALPDGSVAVAFRDGWSRPKIAFSKDGKTFETPILVGPSAGGAMAAAGAFADGSVAFTYQTGSSAMTSWYRVSRDRGATWTEPEKVTTGVNVHDTALLQREDGAVDLYYIYPAGPVGFSTFRRALSVDGELGPEQRVTDDSVGDTSKPMVTRLEDGRLLLVYAEIMKRTPSGEPAEQRLGAALLEGDAPAGGL